MHHCTALILASGFSERMGAPKALLKWDAHTTFIERICKQFTDAGCTHVVCTLNAHTYVQCAALSLPGQVTLVLNRHPELGRLYSIQSGLKALPESSCCFVHNVDNPFVNTRIISLLYEARSLQHWCAPVFDGKSGHPVLLPRTVLNQVMAQTDLSLSLKDILSSFTRKDVRVPDDAVLRNINSPEDYLRYGL